VADRSQCTIFIEKPESIETYNFTDAKNSGLLHTWSDAQGDAQNAPKRCKQLPRGNDMENATDTMILDHATFTGLVKASKTTVLETLWFDFKFAVEWERESLMESFDEKDTDKAHDLRQQSKSQGRKAETLRNTITRILSYDAKGDLDTDRMNDVIDIMTATEDKFAVDAQVAYWERKEREKEEALKAEYMAGFEAWKATQAGA
jgi:hypothetical protein